MSGGRTGVVVMAHGTPARTEDVESFYTEVRRGQPPSAAQLAELRARYAAIGGVSPLNATTEAQALAVAGCLEARRPGHFALRHGARFAEPRIEEAVDQLADLGVERLVGLVLSPHSSRISVGEYARRAGAAADAAAARLHRTMALTMVDHFYDAPGFAELVAIRVRVALQALAGGTGGSAVVVFTAHSVPASVIEAGDSYGEQVAESAEAVAKVAGLAHWRVAWQSAGRTDAEWLGPDLRQVMTEEAHSGTPAVVVCPIGFVSDHLEVLYDLDVEAASVAGELHMGFARSASINADPDFCALLADVVCAADDAGDP